MTDHAIELRDPKTGGPYIGSPVGRVEDARMLQGQGAYVGDLQRGSLAYAAFARSPVAHGRIRGIDVSACLALPGVIGAFTSADVLAALRAVHGESTVMPNIPLRQEAHESLLRFEQPVIATGKVRYVGEPVAMVVANTRAQAEDALEAVVMDIEELPVVAGRDASVRGDVLLFEPTGTNCVMELAATKGDADAAFRDAPYTRRERFAMHRHTAIPMEPRGLLAQWHADSKRMVVEGASKVPFANRRILARLLGLPEASVDMLEVDVGGGFGARGEFYPEDFLVPFASWRTGRPVRWAELRSEHFLATNHARDADCEIEIACDREGHILGLRGRARSDIGAYIRTVGITPSRNIAQVCTGPYRIANVDMRVAVLLSNKTPSATYRAPGRYETDFFRERIMDLAAGDLGIDRVEFRRRNLVRESDMPWAMPTVAPFGDATQTDSGDYAQTLERCLDEFGWDERARLNGREHEGRLHGVALGCYIEGGASGPSESARLVMAPDGRIAVHTGSSAIGQGLETVFTQIAADAMAVPMAVVSGVHHGSTTGVAEGYGTYSSRSVVMGGSAILAAAARLQVMLREAASARFGCAPESVVLAVDGEQGIARAPDGASATWAQLAGSTGFVAEGSFASRKRTYSYGAHAAHVAVDTATGEVEVLEYVAVEDVGRIINPVTLHGQALGAVVQGLGGVLLENLAYDEHGQLLSGSLMDYALPRADDFPRIETIAMESKPSPNNPLGAKGAGEGGVIPVAGVIANAVSAALGVQVHELPLTRERVWRLAAKTG